VIEPRKEVAEADAVMKCGRQHRSEVTAEDRLGRGRRAGHASEGNPESWEISSTPHRAVQQSEGNEAKPRSARSRSVLVVAMTMGNRSRKDPFERSEAPEQRTVWKKDERDVGLENCLNKN
jgi:hypothetical protein